MGFSTKIDMPIHLFRSLMKAFSQIAQKVVFQAFIHADVKRMVDVPTNVLLVEKIPQQSLLAHEKTILFITHCGTNSVVGELYKKVTFTFLQCHSDYRGDLPHRTDDWYAH